jgi:RNA polymerase sigma-70 factor, ECF subfamily
MTAEELLALCVDGGNVRAWEEFLRRFHPLVVATARRTARRYTPVAHDLCDDLAQDVYLKLNADGARLLREFVPRHAGAAFGYLSVLTANVVHDYFKRKGRARRPEVSADYLEAPPPADPAGGG